MAEALGSTGITTTIGDMSIFAGRLSALPAMGGLSKLEGPPFFLKLQPVQKPAFARRKKLPRVTTKSVFRKVLHFRLSCTILSKRPQLNWANVVLMVRSRTGKESPKLASADNEVDSDVQVPD